MFSECGKFSPVDDMLVRFVLCYLCFYISTKFGLKVTGYRTYVVKSSDKLTTVTVVAGFRELGGLYTSLEVLS